MKHPWFPLYVNDFLADTMHLTAEQTGAYLLLLMHYWVHRGLPADDRALRRIARVHPPRWASVKPVLMQFFSLQEGGVMLRSKRMDHEITKTDKLSNNRKGAAEQMLKNKTANAEQVLTHARATSHAHVQRLSLPSEAHPEMKDFGAWPSDYAERFWKKFPNKVGKKAALRQLNGVRQRNEVPFPDLMAALDRYVHKTDDRPWCHPTTWINQGRWTDEPAIPPAPAERNGAKHDQGYGRRGAFVTAADALMDRINSRTIEGEAVVCDAAGEDALRRLPPR